MYWVGHTEIPEIPLSTKDPDLLDALGSKPDIHHAGQADPSRRNRARTPDAVCVRAVFLTGTKTMNKSQMAALIDQYWDHIVQKVGVSSGPSLWSLTQRDGLKPIN